MNIFYVLKNTGPSCLKNIKTLKSYYCLSVHVSIVDLGYTCKLKLRFLSRNMYTSGLIINGLILHLIFAPQVMLAK